MMNLAQILQVEIFTIAFFKEIFRSNTTFLEPVVTSYITCSTKALEHISRILVH